MKKRILAWIAIILLVLLYLSTLIFALMDSSLAQNLLRASIFCTIVIPVMLYAGILVVRVRKQNDQKEENIDKQEES